MKKQIKSLEKQARELEPTQKVRNQKTREITDYTDNFIENLGKAKGFSRGECQKLKSLKFNEDGKDIQQLLSILREEVDSIGINTASGGHLGYIPGGGLWASAMGDMLAAVSNRYAGVAYASPGAVMIENQLIG